MLHRRPWPFLLSRFALFTLGSQAHWPWRANDKVHIKYKCTDLQQRLQPVPQKIFSRGVTGCTCMPVERQVFSLAMPSKSTLKWLQNVQFTEPRHAVPVFNCNCLDRHPGAYFHIIRFYPGLAVIKRAFMHT
ncbi:hypothetical protein B0H13DRAFT_1880355 [Mycena leptocephala]|nr:hypothetical protein B0H13DRAFT_1880355 [Mycena leptocephala]